MKSRMKKPRIKKWTFLCAVRILFFVSYIIVYLPLAGGVFIEKYLYIFTFLSKNNFRLSLVHLELHLIVVKLVIFALYVSMNRSSTSRMLQLVQCFVCGFNVDYLRHILWSPTLAVILSRVTSCSTTIHTHINQLENLDMLHSC